MADELEDSFLKVLGDFGDQLVTDLKESLVKNDVVGGGGTASKFAESIQFTFLTGSEQGIGITMADYWYYIENGRRKGAKPPLDKIIEWIKWKGGVGAFAKNGQVKSLSKRATSDLAKLSNRTLKESRVKRGLKQKAEEDRIKSLAFAIRANIGKYGTSKGSPSHPRGYKGTNFVKEVMEDGRIEELTETMAKEFGVIIQASIVEEFKITL